MARGARLGPIQAIVGEDTFLAEAALERIVAGTLGEERADSLQVLYGDETSWEKVVELARTGSLFVDRRVVAVRRADQLKGDDEAIGAYVQNPSPDVILVLLAARPDRRRSAWKRLLPAATVHAVEPKKGRALRAYVEDELRRRGLSLEPEGVSELIDRVGQDLRRLMGEVEKLEAFAQGQTSISARDVVAVLGRGLARPLYLLGDALAARDAAASLELVEELVGEGEEGLRILAALHRSLRQVRGACAMREARLPRGEIGARLLPPNMQFKLDALLEASARWSEPDLRRAFEALGRADRRLKRGVEAEIALAAVVTEACRIAEEARPSSLRPGR